MKHPDLSSMQTRTFAFAQAGLAHKHRCCGKLGTKDGPYRAGRFPREVYQALILHTGTVPIAPLRANR